MTGSPIPLWHIEQLNDPFIVKTVGGLALELEDGRRISLPFIKTLPPNSPLFQEAISRGIEITPDGEVFGVIWLDRYCGNDPYYWRRVRVNLSDLAAGLYPEGIDDSRIHSDVISVIQERFQIDTAHPTRSHDSLHFSVWDHVRMRAIRREFASSVSDADR